MVRTKALPKPVRPIAAQPVHVSMFCANIAHRKSSPSAYVPCRSGSRAEEGQPLQEEGAYLDKLVLQVQTTV